MEDKQAREMMKDVVMMLINNGHTKEQILNYVKADIVEDVFNELHRGKGGE